MLFEESTSRDNGQMTLIKVSSRALVGVLTGMNPDCHQRHSRSMYHMVAPFHRLLLNRRTVYESRLYAKLLVVREEAAKGFQLRALYIMPELRCKVLITAFAEDSIDSKVTEKAFI